MFITLTTILLAVFTVVLPFFLMILIVNFFIKKDKTSEIEDLKLKVKLMESEIEHIKKYINMIDDI